MHAQLGTCTDEVHCIHSLWAETLSWSCADRVNEAHTSLQSLIELSILICLRAMARNTTLKNFYIIMRSWNIFSGRHSLVNEWEALKSICNGQCWYCGGPPQINQCMGKHWILSTKMFLWVIHTNFPSCFRWLCSAVCLPRACPMWKLAASCVVISNFCPCSSWFSLAWSAECCTQVRTIGSILAEMGDKQINYFVHVSKYVDWILTKWYYMATLMLIYGQLGFVSLTELDFCPSE